MKVTLYKNCKLNNKYKDVFFNKTYLETYLGLLTSIIVLNDSDTFSREIDNLYIDDANITDFKQYNYMKIEDTIGTFYAFVNNIKWVNEVYQIFYEEDIMSNWFEYTHIRNSLLTGNKSLKLYKGTAKRDILLYKYPLQSESNNYIKVESIIPSNQNPKISLIVKLQLYKLNQAGEAENRITLIGAISKYNILTDTINYDLYDNTVSSDFDEFIQVLLNKRGTEQLSYFGENYFYDIDKVYAIPTDFIVTNNVLIGFYSSFKLFDIDANSYYSFVEIRNINNTGITKEYENTISYDRTIDSVGLLTRPIKIANNGTSIKVKFTVYVKGYGFAVFMNVQNKIIEVTNEFLVEMPFTQASSSELQLKRLQLNLEENSLNNKIDNAETNRQRAIANLAIGASTGLLSGVANAFSGNLGGTISSADKMLSSVANSGADIDIAKNDIKYSEERIKLINQTIYSSSSILNNKFTYINALYSVTIFKIDEDNTAQINQAVKLGGYLVRELVNDVIQELDIENLTDHYEVFKFDEVNIYGIIAQDYVRFIERVLTNGVRVWCQGDIGELV